MVSKRVISAVPQYGHGFNFSSGVSIASPSSVNTALYQTPKPFNRVRVDISNPYLFRDTLMKLIEAPVLEYKKLTAA